MTTTSKSAAYTPVASFAPGYCASRDGCPQCNGTGFVFYGGRKLNWTVNDFVPCWTCDATGWRTYSDQRAALARAEARS